MIEQKVKQKLTMKKIILLSAVVFTICHLPSAFLHGQNIAINTTGAAAANCAVLDVSSAAGNLGMLIPRVALGNVTVYAPLIGAPVTGLLVYSTAAPIGGNGTGYYYWDIAAARWVSLVDNLSPGIPWYIAGNTLTGTGIWGSLSNDHVDFYSNNLVRGRLSNLGEFFIGTTATAITGDLMNAVSNAAFPWAINGYSSFDGAGTYGRVMAGATIYAGVQGEYSGTNPSGAGTRGLYVSNTAGTSFAAYASGLSGSEVIVGGNGQYKFGVAGEGGQQIRTAGIFGNDFGVRMAALGYYAASGLDYSTYGFGNAVFTGIAGGKMANPLGDFNNEIGLGMYGGIMGGWIKGLEYGANFSGKRYGAYVDGKTLTNNVYVVLNADATGSRTPSYAATSLSVDINAKGTAALVNGEAEVIFNETYQNLLSKEKPIIVTVSPMGETKGIYIVSVTNRGFKIKENNNGASNATFNWIAIGEKAGEAPQISPEILSKDFDMNIDGVMHNDYGDYPAKAMWWNGTDIQFGEPEELILKVQARKAEIFKSMPVLSRPIENKK